jgi:hypothetical protein
MLNLNSLVCFPNSSFVSAFRLPTLTQAGVEEARDFLNAIEAYHELLKDQGKNALLNFVKKTKITGNAKT